MTHRFKAILFDLDGTIIDSAGDLQATMNTLLAQENRRPISLQEMKSCTGDGLQMMLEKAYRLTGKDAPDVERLMHRFLDIYEGVQASPECIYPGMRELLDDEYRRGTQLGVVTNKHAAAAGRILNQLQLDRFFKSVVDGDSLPQRKPHALPVLHAMRHLGVVQNDTVMIGDSPNDARAAQDAGIPCIIMRYGYTPDWPDDLKPTAFANHVDECRVALQLI